MAAAAEKVSTSSQVLSREWNVGYGEGGRKAFDNTHNFTRYRDLVAMHGHALAKKLFSTELLQDIETYVRELSGVHTMEYQYGVSAQGVLVENTPAKQEVRVMMEQFSSPESQMWLEYMIPMLEFLPDDSTAFALSVRQSDSFIEGAHDYAYFFHKVNQSTIEAFAIELNLQTEQAIEILNEQIGYAYFSSQDSWQEMRQQAFFYPPNVHRNQFSMASDILSVGLKGSTPQELKNEQAVRTFVDTQQQSLKQQQFLVWRITSDLLEAIVRDDFAAADQVVRRMEMDILEKLYPNEIKTAREQGITQLVLPCGLVDLEAPENILTYPGIPGSREILKCVKCPACKQFVDAYIQNGMLHCPNKQCNHKVPYKKTA